MRDKGSPILIVEDERIMRNALIDWLKHEGYPVEGASCGIQALEMIEKNSYSAIIVDLKMPDIDGVSVIRYAKKTVPLVPVVLMTAYPSKDTVVEAMRSGAKEYLVKPFVPEDLEKILLTCSGGEEE